MSDNVNDEEQQQQMEEISISGDVWLGVFAFISPLELGLKVALISDRFDVRVDEHFKLRKWLLGPLRIVRAIDGNGAQIVNNKNSGERLPIPQGPLPNKVIGFEKIEISYIDQSVIEFLQRIRPLFIAETSVFLLTSDDQNRSWEIIWQKLWPLINDKMCGFFLDSVQLDNLRQFSPTVLRNCPNLLFIASVTLFPEFPAEDNAAASSSRQSIAKWLLTPREDGLPKMLYCYLGTMEGLKEAFVNASEPVNFIIRMNVSELGMDPFELTNNSTRERLTLRVMEEGWRWRLVRCPIERDEDKWAKSEKEEMEWEGSRQRNRIVIDFKDSDISDGMLDANDEGPSEPKK